MEKFQKILMKFGTNSLTKNNKLDNSVIQKIAAVTDLLYNHEKKPIIVTSGAVAAGMELNKLIARPKRTEELQDLSAEGARYLWSLYAKAFERYNIGTIYVPITWHSFNTKKEIKNIEKIIERSWEKRKITIWNTNDALTNEELIKVNLPNGFYDNDPLAARLAVAANADLLIFFTDYGIMGSGGKYSKIKAIETAKKEGIFVDVKSINYLDEMLKGEIKWKS